MLEVTRDVGGEPVRAEEVGLGTVGVGDGDQEDAVGREQGAEIVESLAGVEEVLEAMPEGDAVEGAAWRASPMVEKTASWGSRRPSRLSLVP